MTSPATSLLGDDTVLVEHLEHALGGIGSDGVPLRLSALLRHLPGRRAALLAEHEGEPVVVKVFASPRARGNHRRLTALDLAGLSSIAPRSLAVWAEGHVGVLSFAPGWVLDEGSDDELVAGARGAGLALGRLHGSGVRLDRTWTWRDEVDQLVRRAPGSLLPLAYGAQQRPLHDTLLVPSHRDFHPRQVVITTEGTIRLIDFDDAAMAPAGLDVGNMVAHLRREAVVHGRPRAVVESAVRAFLAAYGSEPRDLQQWVRLALIRLAGLAETRHRDLAQRDALMALVGPALAAAAPTVLVTGHDDRPVRVEDRPGRGRVVVKGYRRGGGAEVYEVMTALWSSSFGAHRVPRPGLPRPLGWSPPRAELTMEFLPGEPVASRGSLGASLEVADDAARLLADLHRSGVTVERRRPLHRLVRSAARKARDREGSAGGEFARTLASLEAALSSQPPEPAPVLSHGDFSPRNVMRTDRGLVLFDLDRVQLAAPARDVAYWGAWLWTTNVLAGAPSPDSWALSDPFTAAYAAHAATGTAPTPEELAFHRALGLVRIAHGWSSLREDPAAVSMVLTEARRLVAAL